MNPELRSHPAFRETCQFIAELSLISHVGATAYDGKMAKATDEDIGGRRPSGSDREPAPRDLGEIADWKASHHRRTVDYFRRHLEACQSVFALERLRDEARATLEAWRRQPLPDGQEPEFGSPQWKRWVAESSLDGGELARRFNVSRQYIGLIRKQYRKDEVA